MDKSVKLNQDLNLFSQAIESSKEGLRKPDPKIYERLELAIHSSEDEIYFIDDSEANLETAIERCWRVFHYSLGTDSGRTSNNLIRKDLIKGR